MKLSPLVAPALVIAGAVLGYGYYASVDRVDRLDADDVRAIIDETLSAQEPARMNTADLDPAVLNPMIEDFLVSDPRVLERVSIALRDEMEAEARATERILIARYEDQIFNDPDGIVVGNPDGDVTLVEMFDYNCGYCRQSLPELLQLVDEDPNLKVILREFPILSQGSMDAARISLAVSRTDADYFTFHQKVYASRGAVDAAAALAVATEMGLNAINLQLSASEGSIQEAVERSYALAQALDVSGTPTFIIGDEIVRGAVGIDALRDKIANVRECGSTACGT